MEASPKSDGRWEAKGLTTVYMPLRHPENIKMRIFAPTESSALSRILRAEYAVCSPRAGEISAVGTWSRREKARKAVPFEIIEGLNELRESLANLGFRITILRKRKHFLHIKQYMLAPRRQFRLTEASYGLIKS